MSQYGEAERKGRGTIAILRTWKPLLEFCSVGRGNWNLGNEMQRVQPGRPREPEAAWGNACVHRHLLSWTSSAYQGPCPTPTLLSGPRPTPFSSFFSSYLFLFFPWWKGSLHSPQVSKLLIISQYCSFPFSTLSTLSLSLPSLQCSSTF